MPKIDIKERDLTTAGRVEVSNNVVYVPGFVNHINSKYEGKIKFPYLFDTIEEFKSVFSQEDGSFELLGYAAEATKENGVDSSVTQDSSEKTADGVEKSQLYALSLLQLGLPVLFDLVEGKATEEKPASEYLTSMSTYLTLKNLKKLEDKNTYNIKFLTSGGYYIDGLGSTLISIASSRGDCTALVDHEEANEAISISNIESSYGKVGDTSKYGAIFTPWCAFQFPKWDSKKITPLTSMPGSLAYLLAFANSVANNNSNWLAAAGMNRGIVPYLEAPLVNLTQSDIDSYQKSDGGISINPITNITPQGVIVWGNRTLYNSTSGLIASNFLNIRQLCNDIKKTLYTACKYLTFEQNSDILWVKFKSLITPLLDQMQTGDGISGYQIAKKKSTAKATLTAVIRIYPIEAVEDFDITLELADDSTATITGNI